MYSSAANRRALFGQQGGRCTGCLKPFPYRNFTVDHILPQSKGGGDALGNLQLLCGACNSKKGAGTQEELHAGLVAEGVIREVVSLIGWLIGRRKGYAPAGEGTMSPVAAVAVPLVTIALPYVVAGAIKTVEIAYEHRAGIKQEAEKQARRVKGVKVPMPDVSMPRLPMWRSRHDKWNAAQEERMAVHHWWWWTASGSDEARATA